MQAVKSFWSNEPVIATQLAGVIVSVAGIFGFSLTTEQAVGLIAFVQLVVTIIQRSQVSPTNPTA